MSDAYKIANQSNCYYLTFQIVDWVDIFTREIYRKIILDSFSYCRKNKGLNIWSYVIMSNHVHCILSSSKNNLSDIIRDFKSYTAKEVIKAMEKGESRKNWILKRFEFKARSNVRDSNFQIWTNDNHAIEIDSTFLFNQKMSYIHLNPVRAGLVENAEDWLCSSQRNYSGLKALIEIDISDL
ncbi:MAG: transposase [Saprospiraceae bacterium]|nr:transposase [Saprospiraceae bacterium]